ncbi:MAG: shikimate dehydrogenase [Woeseiaceae bacterium]|nr:shikimate dehydrogenase [Woeseiaceae bacterium]
MTTIDRYGVMGYPVSHSRSPVIHRLFALQTNQNIQYELLQVAPEKLETAVRQFQRTGGRGLNVTVPHKAEVAKLCDHLSERASTAGAVNTLAFIDGEIHGDNTDGIGLLRDLAVNLGIQLEGSRILILGAGGATRGIVGPLLEMQPASLLIANRTVGKAEIIADHFKRWGPVASSSFDDIPVDQKYDLIINATSAGFKGEAPPYPSSAVSPETICYDLSYGLTPTPFSVWAREHGAAQSVMGWGMLVEQAAESFNIWRGVRPDTAPVLKQMKITA